MEKTASTKIKWTPLTKTNIELMKIVASWSDPLTWTKKDTDFLEFFQIIAKEIGFDLANSRRSKIEFGYNSGKSVSQIIDSMKQVDKKDTDLSPKEKFFNVYEINSV
jgi:hypothetical protein